MKKWKNQVIKTKVSIPNNWVTETVNGTTTYKLKKFEELDSIRNKLKSEIELYKKHSKNARELQKQLDDKWDENENT